VEIERLLEGHTDRHEEAVIVRMLEGLDDAELDEVIASLDVPKLLDSVDDRLRGPDHYTSLLGLLTMDRLHALGTASRASLLRGLQTGRTSSKDEQAVLTILTGTKGERLTRLKAAVDRGLDHRDMHQLVFRDVDDEDIRGLLLAHLQDEGAELPMQGFKLLSDIDDTVYANWKDTRFPKKSIYPGVRQLYLEVLRPTDDEQDEPEEGPIFVTARPKDRPGIIENKSLRHLTEIGFKHASVLAGSISKLHSNDAIARKKAQNFLEFQQLYPEYGFVFFGDSGQGDAQLAERIVKEPGPHGAHTFIHDEVDTATDDRASWAGRGVHFFDSYLEAGAECFERELIGVAGLHRVEAASLSELEALSFDDDELRAARTAELKRAIEHARAAERELER
jgi:hypothetical protein